MTGDVANAQKSWSEAREVCQKFCMDLVALESAEEDQFILDKVENGT